jgi:diguanylate cyclase (GGDEF)-like protein
MSSTRPISTVNTRKTLLMENLIKHMVEITCHRDHTLLDVSVVSALHELADASQVRALEIFRYREALFVRQRVWVEAGKVVSVEESVGDDHGGEPISTYPALVACIEQQLSSTQQITSDGLHVLWLPVWFNDKVSSCIEISSQAPYSAQTLRVIHGVLSVYRNYQNLLDYSERDSLTGLLNRKTFDEKFSKMVSAKTPPDEPPRNHKERRNHTDHHEQWLAVVDIDHFKRVNDQFGHLYGDEVLILVANLLRASFRAQDRVFRFGGEEFVILLRSTTLADAHKIFERFRAGIERHIFPQVGKVTVSLGFASISYETPVVILGHADQALYYAKANGRNRVCHYDELVSRGHLQSEISNESVEFFFDDLTPG